MCVSKPHTVADATEAFLCLLLRDDTQGASAFLLDMCESELRQVRLAAANLAHLAAQRRLGKDGLPTFNDLG